MESLFALIFAAIVITVQPYIGSMNKTEAVPQPSYSQMAVLASTEENKQTAAAFSIDTSITSGPKQNQIITDTNKITFVYKGTVYPQSTKYTMKYETKVDGIDTTWQQTYSTTRTIEVKPGTYKYTFWVRAKFGNYTDLTPAKIIFYVRISPYYGKVKISSVSHSLISLSPQLKTTSERVNITGWKIKGQKGEITIPAGVELLLPGSSVSASDVLAKQNDKINIYSGKDSLNINKTFRSNKCFGYLKSSYSSWPSSLPADSKLCPKINREEIGLLSKNCQTSVFSLESCKPLEYSKNMHVYSDSTCQSYVDNYTGKYLNYNGCVENYSKDKDFFKNYWYLYAGYDIVCNCNENMYLYDKSGLLVDKYSYKMTY